MQSDNHEDLTLKELIEKKEKLLKAKEELIKERNEIIREQQLPLRDAGPVDKSEPPSKSKAPEEQSAFPGIFGSSSSPTSQKSPESQGRRDFLRNLSVGITLTISSIGVVLLLSAPSIERAAYFQLCLLFEQGSIFFTNKIRNVRPSAKRFRVFAGL